VAGPFRLRRQQQQQRGLVTVQSLLASVSCLVNHADPQLSAARPTERYLPCTYTTTTWIRRQVHPSEGAPCTSIPEIFRPIRTPTPQSLTPHQQSPDPTKSLCSGNPQRDSVSGHQEKKRVTATLALDSGLSSTLTPPRKTFLPANSRNSASNLQTDCRAPGRHSS